MWPLKSTKHYVATEVGGSKTSHNRTGERILKSARQNDLSGVTSAQLLWE